MLATEAPSTSAGDTATEATAPPVPAIYAVPLAWQRFKRDDADSENLQLRCQLRPGLTKAKRVRQQVRLLSQRRHSTKYTYQDF